MTHRLYSTTALAALLATPSVAAAQVATAPPPAAAAQAPETAAVSPLSDDIVVTGSRLSGSALTAPSPVTVLSQAQISQSGLENVADVVTDLPSVGVGLTDSNSQNDATRVGLNLVDLRNLGTQRTLVLVNGRRQVPGDITTSAVDLNTIPSTLVERVEVVTGGTSAVYGADAVSGVINLILKRDFSGLEARVQSGITSRGDGRSYGLSLTGGHNFGDGRGNIAVNLLYDKVDGVGAIQRDYASNGLNLIDNPAGTKSNDGIPNRITRNTIRFYDANQLGFINLGQFGAYVPTTGPGGIRPFNFGDPAFGSANETDFRQVGGDAGFFEQYDNLSLPLERYGASATAHFDLADNVTLFAEGKYIRTKVQSSWQPVADSFQYFSDSDLTRIRTDNPFFPPALRPGFLQLPPAQQSFVFLRVYDDFGRRSSDVTRDQQQYTLGLEGKVFGNFKYNVFGSYGRTSIDAELLNGRNQDRYLESVDVVLLNGAPACRSAAARANGCQPFNPLNPSSTPAGIAYSRFNDRYSANIQLKNAGASLSGDLFSLWAGPIAAAAGVEYRETSLRTFPSAALQSGRIYYPQQAPVSGTIKSSEAFAEIRVPLLADIPGVRSLELQAAGRVADYNTTGTNFTWNVGGTYTPFDGVRFRVVKSKAVRAPNVTELFSPQQGSFQFIQDPCSATRRNDTPSRNANCTALGIPATYVSNDSNTVAGQEGGNPNLDVEIAKTWTAGVVLTPRFLPGFSATIDYYDINITGAIAALGFQTLANNCVDLPVPIASNVNCSVVTRGPAFNITNIQATALNLGRISTRGVDFSVNYGFGLDRIGLPGRLSLGINGTYLDRLRRQVVAADPRTLEQLENRLGKPQWEFLASGTYAVDKFSITWRAHYLDSTYIEPSTSVASPPPPDRYDLPYTGTEVFHDLSLNFDVNRNFGLRFNVNNIFDNKPPARGNRIHQGAGDASIYPNLGTNFNLAVTMRL